MNIPASPRTSRRGWLIAVLILIIVALAVALIVTRSTGGGAQMTGPGGPGGPGGPRGGPPMGMMGMSFLVSATAAEKTDLNLYLDALGTVTAYNTVDVRARVSGQLAKVLFEEGQEVKAGEVLAQIDPRPYRAALAQAEGTLKENEAQLRNAELDVERYRSLYAEDSVAKQTLDTQEALVRQRQGTVENSRAQVDDARLNLEFTEVRAPIAGRLGLRKVDVGNLVTSGDTDPLVVITQTRPITVVFSLPEYQLQAVRRRLAEGGQVAVQAFDRNRQNKLATGRLATLDNQIDTTTGTFKLKAVFDNADNALFPNQFVNVRLHALQLKDAVIVPSSALQRDDSGTYVYLLGEGNKVAKRAVKVGESQGEKVELREGVAAGERVVTEGTDRLRDGMSVRVSGEAGANGKPGATHAPGARGAQNPQGAPGAAPADAAANGSAPAGRRPDSATPTPAAGQNAPAARP